MALAGPAANLALILLAAALIRIGMSLDWFVAPLPLQTTWTQVTVAKSPGMIASAAVVISVLFSLNLILLVFNLVPLPPLDGSEVVSLFLDDHTAERYREFMAQPGVSLIGLIVAWNVMGYVLDPVYTVALSLLYPGVRYG